MYKPECNKNLDRRLKIFLHLNSIFSPLPFLFLFLRLKSRKSSKKNYLSCIFLVPLERIHIISSTHTINISIYKCPHTFQIHFTLNNKYTQKRHENLRNEYQKRAHCFLNFGISIFLCKFMF